MDKFAIMSLFQDDYNHNHQYLSVATSKEQALSKVQALVNKFGRWCLQSHTILTSWEEILELEFPSLGELPTNDCFHIIYLSRNYNNPEWEKEQEKEDEKYQIYKYLKENIKIPKKDRRDLGGES